MVLRSWIKDNRILWNKIINENFLFHEKVKKVPRDYRDKVHERMKLRKIAADRGIKWQIFCSIRLILKKS